MAYFGFRYQVGFKQLALSTVGITAASALLLGSVASSALAKPATQPVSQHSVLRHKVASTNSNIPQLRLKAGHTYYLSPSQMKRILGASNPQIQAGKIGIITNPSQGSYEDALPITEYIVDYPDGVTEVVGQYVTQGWNVFVQANGSLVIHVSLNAPVGVGYYAFCVTHISRFRDKYGDLYTSSAGPAAYFDVVP